MSKVLVLLHTNAAGGLPKAALETLGAASGLGQAFAVGIVGSGAQAACDQVQGCGATAFYAVEDAAVAQARYASDVAAATAILQAAQPELILAPQTSRFARSLPGAAHRFGAQIDTHIVGLAEIEGQLNAQRWFYRQRILGHFSRLARPWILLLDGGVYQPWEGAPGSANAQVVAVDFDAAHTRVTVNGIEKPLATAQTIRPDAPLLFVAGAGWTKAQKDGAAHIDVAGKVILEFLQKAKASLGSSKSLVDIQGDGQQTLTFMTHMNQIGQTGSTPRHVKGLATCCHGEEPHTVGWRFITERRAINLDANCGWAQGKADVLYVADAFEVMQKVNALLG